VTEIGAAVDGHELDAGAEVTALDSVELHSPVRARVLVDSIGSAASTS
jgi:hypothetical protein